jgi:hypothetical protein
MTWANWRVSAVDRVNRTGQSATRNQGRRVLPVRGTNQVADPNKLKGKLRRSDGNSDTSTSTSLLHSLSSLHVTRNSFHCPSHSHRHSYISIAPRHHSRSTDINKVNNTIHKHHTTQPNALHQTNQSNHRNNQNEVHARPHHDPPPPPHARPKPRQ